MQDRKAEPAILGDLSAFPHVRVVGPLPPKCLGFLCMSSL